MDYIRIPRLHVVDMPCIRCGQVFPYRFERGAPLRGLTPWDQLCDACFVIAVHEGLPSDGEVADGPTTY